MQVLIHAPEFSDCCSPHQIVIDLVFHTGAGIKCCLFILTETVVTDAANDEWGQRTNLLVQRVQKIEAGMEYVFIRTSTIQVHIKNIDLAIGVPKIKKDKKNKEETGVRWKFLVTHNKVGGFRQVILRDGRAIFTRLTQPVGEVTPAVVAGNIEQEITSTIEYMNRL